MQPNNSQSKLPVGESVSVHSDKSIKPVKRLMTPFLSKKVPAVPDESERKTLPLLTKDIFSRIFFTWLIPLFNRGYKRTLEANDLWRLDNRLSIDSTYPRFQHHLNEIIRKHRLKTGQESYIPKSAIIKALFYTFKWEYLFAIAATTCNFICQVTAPVLVKKLIDVVETKVLLPDSSINYGIGYVFGIVILLALSVLFANHALLNSKLVGAHARTILTKALLEKSLVANSKTKHDFSNGKVFSLMSGDLAKIDMGISFLPFALATPVPIAAAIAILIVNLGAVALTGIGIFALTVAMYAIPAMLLMKYKAKAAVYTDKRIESMREVLNAMKIIKFHVWEDAYQDKIFHDRTKESHYIFKCEWIINLMYGSIFNITLTSSMTTFLVFYAVRSKNGSPGSIFASLALYNVLMVVVVDFPMLLGHTASAAISLNRIREFLQAPVEDEKPEEKETEVIDKDTAIKLVDGYFEWENFENNEKTNEFCLKKIDLEIRKGEFVVVTGPTGSGKSSLLHAITNGMNKTNGTVSINGSSIFYGVPWIQSATIRENIIFGFKFNPILYYRTVKACALETDINLLAAGDMTEVGERGVTLSGGQKARISLARAIYAQKDIYLLDDVLSAVDAKVGKHIVEHCFLDLIADKTKILATHQLSQIYKADRIVFMNEGTGTIDVGTAEELLERNPKFVSLMGHAKIYDTNKLPKLEEGNTEDLEDHDTTEGGLYNVEERAVNAISFSIYKQYVKAGSGIFSIFMIPVIIGTVTLTIFTTMFANVWLSFWIDYKFPNKSDSFYIGLYVMFVFLALIFVVLELAAIGYLSINAAKNLNLNSVKKLLHTTMSFLDTTPSGRILNRFTKDTNSLDNEISNQLKLFIHMVASIIGILILCVIYLPWFAIAIPLLVIIFFSITAYYQASSREVKRLEALSRSHVYNNFNEVLEGMSTIKSYNSQERFMKKNDEFVDKLNESYFVTVANQRWIGITLDLTGCGVAFIVTMLALTRQFNISASSTGLITTYILDFATSLSVTLVAYSEVENEMNSVERLCHYANNLEQEAAYKIPGHEPAPDWPQKGHIEFKNVSLRYREELPLVIKNLQLDVKPKEKIGICGRTGAGKSSLITALYRLSEVTKGKIEIDGVDVSTIGLHDLRSKLSIIPQDPVLFKGTIRKNLDPFNERTDMELWDALRRSGNDLKNIKESKSHKFHLDSIVEDGGSNYSLGERQLLTLARALIGRTKILIMDEATSSVDYATDALVQKTIAKEFKDCTILCIAHRLKTVLHYDKILVLDKGEMLQYDTPLALFNEKGPFREMCNDSNITLEDFSTS